MVTLSYRLLTRLTLVLGLAASLAACDSSAPDPVTPPPVTPPPVTPPATTGTVSGLISLPPGASGSVQNTRVAIYISADDLNNDRVLASTAVDANGNFALPNTTPGSYYLDAWKDNNNNQRFDAGDFYGVYGSGTFPNYQPSPFQVAAGQTAGINSQIFVIPARPARPAGGKLSR